jgi:hypothetical protein
MIYTEGNILLRITPSIHSTFAVKLGNLCEVKRHRDKASNVSVTLLTGMAEHVGMEFSCVANSMMYVAKNKHSLSPQLLRFLELLL